MKVTKATLKKAVKGLRLSEEDFNLDPSNFFCHRVVDHETTMFNHFCEMVLEYINVVMGITITKCGSSSGFGRMYYTINPDSQFLTQRELVISNVD